MLYSFSLCHANISHSHTRGEFLCFGKKTKAAVTKKARRVGKVYFSVGKVRRRGALNNFHTLHRWQICGVAKNKSAAPQQHGAHTYTHRNNLWQEPFAAAAGPNLIFPGAT
jgi:hypothetical protein